MALYTGTTPVSLSLCAARGSQLDYGLAGSTPYNVCSYYNYIHF